MRVVAYLPESAQDAELEEVADAFWAVGIAIQVTETHDDSAILGLLVSTDDQGVIEDTEKAALRRAIEIARRIGPSRPVG